MSIPDFIALEGTRNFIFHHKGTSKDIIHHHTIYNQSTDYAAQIARACEDVCHVWKPRKLNPFALLTKLMTLATAMLSLRCSPCQLNLNLLSQSVKFYCRKPSLLEALRLFLAIRQVASCTTEGCESGSNNWFLSASNGPVLKEAADRRMQQHVAANAVNMLNFTHEKLGHCWARYHSMSGGRRMLSILSKTKSWNFCKPCSRRCSHNTWTFTKTKNTRRRDSGAP